jgi:hypothetical protein
METARLTVPNGPPITGSGSKWVDASRAQVQGNEVRVQVLEAAVAPAELKAIQKQHATERDYLVIRLRVTNGGVTGPFSYEGWSNPDHQARLSDDKDTNYRQQTFTPGEEVVGQVSGPREVSLGGKHVEDVLVFPVPPEEAKYLYLELPGSACGIPGTFRLAIPSSFISR